MSGWNFKILKIDLTTRTWTRERPEPAVYHKFIGGKGLAGYYLRDHITRDWYDPAMPLLIFAGPLVGTPAPTSGRLTNDDLPPGLMALGNGLAAMVQQAGPIDKLWRIPRKMSSNP